MMGKCCMDSNWRSCCPCPCCHCSFTGALTRMRSTKRHPCTMWKVFPNQKRGRRNLLVAFFVAIIFPMYFYDCTFYGFLQFVCQKDTYFSSTNTLGKKNRKNPTDRPRNFRKSSPTTQGARPPQGVKKRVSHGICSKPRWRPIHWYSLVSGNRRGNPTIRVFGVEKNVSNRKKGPKRLVVLGFI